jgi:EmrB/QacA subfamily drug resistance transporter
VLGSLLLAGLAFALAQTVVAPAIPAIARDFDTSITTATWVLTGFLLSASVATPLIGKAGDLFGKARVLTAVLVVFSAGGVVCALAPSVEVLIAGRVVMGVGGGIFPLAFGIIRDTFPPARVPQGIGLMSAVFGIGGGLGLPLSGVIVDNADVHWLFWMALMALPAAVAIRRFVPASPARARVRLDWAGAAVLSVGLVALLLGITQANAWGWGSARVVALIAGGLVVLAAWVALERRVPEPLVDMRVLGRRPVLLTNLAAMLIGFAMFCSFLLVPQFAQAPEAIGGYGFSASVTEAGLLMMPSALVMLVAGPAAGALSARLGPRVPLAAGTVLGCVSFALLAVAHSEVWHFVVGVTLLGVGIGFAFASMANLVVGSVEPRDVGIATGINTIARTIGGALGAAAATAIVTAQTVPGTPLPVEAGYTEAFAAAAAVGLLAFGATLAIPGPGARAPRAPVPAPARA